MSLYDMLNYANVKQGLSIGGFVFVVVTGLLQFSKIPINPWSAILKWLGNLLNADLKAAIDLVDTKLDKHIQESDQERLENTRRDILDFCNACMNGRKHTQEQYKFIIKKCDSYEKYIEDNDLKNGEVSSAIEEIRRLYTKCIQSNSFLKEWEHEEGEK